MPLLSQLATFTVPKPQLSDGLSVSVFTGGSAAVGEGSTLVSTLGLEEEELVEVIVTVTGSWEGTTMIDEITRLTVEGSSRGLRNWPKTVFETKTTTTMLLKKVIALDGQRRMKGKGNTWFYATFISRRRNEGVTTSRQATVRGTWETTNVFAHAEIGTSSLLSSWLCHHFRMEGRIRRGRRALCS